MAALILVGAAACSGRSTNKDGGHADAAFDGGPEIGADSAYDTAPAGADSAHDTAPADADAAHDAASDTGGADGASGRGTGHFGAHCTSSSDCACGFYCQGPTDEKICMNSTGGLPCLEDCDCTSGGQVCNPNNGYPVCLPPDAGLCVPSGCDSNHHCCTGVCCQTVPAPDGGYQPGICVSAC